MKKYLSFFIILLLGLLIASCDDDPTGPGTIDDETGGILVQSTPAGAEIWLDGTNTGKTTPDSLVDLDEGSYQVTLSLSGYRDTTVTANVTAGFQSSIQVTLSRSSSRFGPVRLWETTGTTAAQPSGLDLSSGMAYGISGDSADVVDIYYSSSGFVIRSSDDVNARSTVFYLGNSDNLDDGEDSPLAQNAGQGGWTDRVSDTAQNYFFLFDSDLHYAKMIITDMGGGTPGNPAWVEVEWIYNDGVNDQEF